MQARRQHHARIPRQVLGERLLRLGAHDRIELFVLVIALHEACAFERLGLRLIATWWLIRETEAVEADTSLERLAAERTYLCLFEVERWILLQFLVDHVLQLHRGELKDVVRADLFWRDLELLLRKKSQIHCRLPYPHHGHPGRARARARRIRARADRDRLGPFITTPEMARTARRGGVRYGRTCAT